MSCISMQICRFCSILRLCHCLFWLHCQFSGPSFCITSFKPQRPGYFSTHRPSWITYNTAWPSQHRQTKTHLGILSSFHYHNTFKTQCTAHTHIRPTPNIIIQKYRNLHKLNDVSPRPCSKQMLLNMHKMWTSFWVGCVCVFVIIQSFGDCTYSP